MSYNVTELDFEKYFLIRKNTLYSYLKIQIYDEEVDLLNTYTLGIDIGSTTVKIAILDENEKLLFATDTYMIKYAFHGLDYIMIEANYDIELVEEDAQRKRLIQSHMSIDTTIQYLKSIEPSTVKRIYLMHLSSRHSNEEDFKRRVQAATGKVAEVCQE